MHYVGLKCVRPPAVIDTILISASCADEQTTVRSTLFGVSGLPAGVRGWAATSSNRNKRRADAGSKGNPANITSSPYRYTYAWYDCHDCHERDRTTMIYLVVSSVALRAVDTNLALRKVRFFVGLFSLP
eukprot:scaffold150951_cov24-Prasinocladus_malaysianus.AAC.1